ncbi:DUF397 domain-containing protein [Streptomyces sp. NBC_01216]|uniref:DUF397 domain-containing protein n=1 Tax=Streptomyces sp. NBC_01216 TaxID=2903778 RepID=UPI002E125E98|nr:DUF397 domain-containing protein [Streptomyces sp. NBC_01216]
MIRTLSTGDASEPVWFKSSYSSGSEGDSCVEVATTPGTVHVRDSKCLDGPRLAVGRGAWSGFVAYASDAH